MTAQPKLNLTLLNTLDERSKRVMTESREEESRMNDELCIAMSEAEEREMETSAMVRAGASLMPSPMNATMALSFSFSSDPFFSKSFLSHVEEPCRRGPFSCNERILLAFSVGKTPAKT